MNIGPLELGIVLLIILVIFGPKRLPSLGRSLGGGMREFKEAITGRHKDGDDEDDEDEDQDANAAMGRPELSRSEAADPLTPAPDTTRAPAGERDESATRPGA